MRSRKFWRTNLIARRFIQDNGVDRNANCGGNFDDCTFGIRVQDSVRYALIIFVDDAFEDNVAVGDNVRKGDVVAKLVTDRIRWKRQFRAAALREKKAALETAKAQLSLTRVELKRLASLKKSVAFSQARYDDKSNEVVKYRSEMGEQEAAVISAKAELQLAEIDLHNSII